MAKQSKTVSKKQYPNLTRSQRREIAKKIAIASKFTPEELEAELRQHPNGNLARQVCVEYFWNDFLEKAGYKEPERESGMSDEEYEVERQAFSNFLASEKKIAMFWYSLGVKHQDTMMDLLKKTEV